MSTGRSRYDFEVALGGHLRAGTGGRKHSRRLGVDFANSHTLEEAHCEKARLLIQNLDLAH